MAHSDKTNAGAAPGASGKESSRPAGDHTKADGHVSGGTATSTPAPGESKSADPRDDVA